jgi:DNA-binding response OmpR family regulator
LGHQGKIDRNMTAQCILVVEDDSAVREVVVDCLRDAGFSVLEAANGAEGLAAVRAHAPDAVILDLGLPDVEGLTLPQIFRQARPGVGLIILSGRSAPVERIVGLELGADDYVCKPFEIRELLARVRSVLRRAVPFTVPAPAAIPQTRFRFAGFTLDLGTVSLTGPDGCPISLSSSEFALLKVFAERPNRVLSRDQIIELTHVNDSPAFDRSVDVQVVRLRKRIDLDPTLPSMIKTIRNQGYLFAIRVDRV